VQRQLVKHTFGLKISRSISFLWVIALGGQYLGRNLNAASSEPYVQLAGMIVLCVGMWDDLAPSPGQTLEAAHDPDHSHDHHAHGTDVRRVGAGYGVVALEVFEVGAPPHWRLRSESASKASLIWPYNWFRFPIASRPRAPCKPLFRGF
jgi:nickel/cobalt exporter